MGFSNSLEVTNLMLGGDNLLVTNELQVANELLPLGVTLPTPTFNPVAGSYGPAQSVTITSTGATAIYYTTDGSTPTTGSTLYSGPVTVSVSETLKALATAAGYNNSPVGSAAYVINGACGTPVFSPIAGSYLTTQSVTITSANSTEIYYTTDGSTPTIPPTGTSTLYTGAISVSTSETLQAIGGATGYSNSAVGSASYVITTLVGEWKMEDGSGTTATDSSLSGNNLTITPGTGSWSTLAGTNGVYLFDGSATVMEASTYTNLNFERTNPFSIFAVFEPTGSGSGTRTLIGRPAASTPAGSAYRGWELFIQWNGSSAYTVQFLLSSGYPSSVVYVQTTGLISLNNLYNVLVTYDGSSLAAGVNIYVNGVSKTLTVNNDNLTTTTQNTISPWVGNSTPSGGQAFKGYIGPTYVWNRTLTATEASNLNSNFYAPPN